jgi:hypothetical protein
METAEKEVQDTPCREVWWCPPALEVPQDWGISRFHKDFLEEPIHCLFQAHKVPERLPAYYNQFYLVSS